MAGKPKTDKDGKRVVADSDRQESGERDWPHPPVQAEDE